MSNALYCLIKLLSGSFKILIKSFYNILLECETYDNKNTLQKNSFFQKYLNLVDEKKYAKNDDLVKYFDQYQSFCIDLDINSVIKGGLNFTYK